MNMTRNILLPLLLLCLAVASSTNLIDGQAETLVNRSLTRALTAYAAARGLNGVISVAQGTEVAVQPAGIGVTFTPGQILDPVNDLIERFSWIMLVASTSIGIQKLLLELCQWPFFSISVSILAIVGVLLVWRKNESPLPSKAFISKVLVMLLLLRFSVPVLAIGGELIFTTFLDDNYQSASSDIKKTTTYVEKLNDETSKTNSAKENSGWFSDSINQAKSIVKSLDISARITQYQKAAEDAISATLSLVVIFLFQTVLIPIGFILVVKSLVLRNQTSLI